MPTYFDTLGIEPTKDRLAIRNAFVHKIAAHYPYSQQSDLDQSQNILDAWYHLQDQQRLIAYFNNTQMQSKIATSDRTNEPLLRNNISHVNFRLIFQKLCIVIPVYELSSHQPFETDETAYNAISSYITINPIILRADKFDFEALVKQLNSHLICCDFNQIGLDAHEAQNIVNRREWQQNFSRCYLITAQIDFDNLHQHISEQQHNPNNPNANTDHYLALKKGAYFFTHDIVDIRLGASRGNNRNSTLTSSLVSLFCCWKNITSTGAEVGYLLNPFHAEEPQLSTTYGR